VSKKVPKKKAAKKKAAGKSAKKNVQTVGDPDAIAPTIEPVEPKVLDPTKAEGVEPRGFPYIWVTWLCGPLDGEEQCQYAGWFKTHFKYPKEDSDLDEWKRKHAALVAKRATELIAEGWNVTIEDQNAMKVNGDAATVSGKPDIVARKNDDVLIVDAKTGKQKGKDRWQVRIYIALIPFAKKAWANLKFFGEVRYTDDEKLVHITSEAKQRIFELVRVFAAPEAPARVGSKKECRWCEIPACPDRVDTGLEGSAQGVF